MRSRNRQEQQAKETKDEYSRRMLLFYAVECGGKYQLMAAENRLYSQLPEDQQGYMHDIKRILKAVGIEGKCTFPILKSTKGDVITPAHYQEMWRYGINCENAKEAGKIIEENMLEALKRLRELEKRK